MRETALPQMEQDAASAWDEKRKHKRKPVLWAARIETQAGEPAECIILDLSLGGAKLRCAAKVAARQPVRLVIDRFGVLRGQVAWVRSGMIGLHFIDPPEQISHIVGAKLPL